MKNLIKVKPALVKAQNCKNATAPRILITGASRGIGRAISLECARRGAIVGANYLRSLVDAESLQNAFPDNIRLLPFDVRDFKAVHDAFNSFVATEGRLDILLNNAGVGGKPQFLVKGSQDLIDEIIGVNMMGTTYCTHAALQSMMKARSGQIITISSLAVSNPKAGMSVYAASKSANEALVTAVAKEYSSRGINAYGIRFGAVNTDMTRDWITGEMKNEIWEPEEIADLVTDLIFGETSYENGSIISLSHTDSKVCKS